MIEGHETAENWFLPDRQADAVAVLESEGGFFVGEAEFFRLGPEFDHVRRGNSRLDDADGGVHVVAATLVGIIHRRGGAADGESPVVAGPVTVVAVKNVEERRIARTQDPVGINMRMRAAVLARN